MVRPGVAGSTRRPASAKKIALISSDLPRENSATKATTSFSWPSRSRSPESCDWIGRVEEFVVGEEARHLVEPRDERAASR